MEAEERATKVIVDIMTPADNRKPHVILSVAIREAEQAAIQRTREGIRDVILAKQAFYNQEPDYSLVASFAEIAMTAPIK